MRVKAEKNEITSINCYRNEGERLTLSTVFSVLRLQ